MIELVLIGMLGYLLPVNSLFWGLYIFLWAVKVIEWIVSVVGIKWFFNQNKLD